jgi:mono/diheme cytochrome c family protein
VESRCRLAWLLGCICLALTASGCSDALNAGPLQYVEAEALTKDLGEKAHLHDKPNLRKRVRQALAQLFGPTPQEIHVPEGSGLTNGGVYLANYLREGTGEGVRLRPIYQGDSLDDPRLKRQTGGYAVYRRNCLHCHGVSGAGDGPTAPFLYPPPRDYRKGIFKFTSTPDGVKPHRDDLRRTITYGLHGTSMPAFESLLTEYEIEEVVEHVIFLSMRGQTELFLIDEAYTLVDEKPEELTDDLAKEVANGVFQQWKNAQTKVVNPPIARTPPTRESILRGRDVFLGGDCKDCHGRLARGDGESFVKQELFNEIVFGGNPSERQARIDELPETTKKLWTTQKLDDWGNPLRPANLNRSLYKGGRRPIDIYWRIANGIKGAQMPGHYNAVSFDEKKIWDVVNFVLALPFEPELLKGANPPPAATGPAVAVK